MLYWHWLIGLRENPQTRRNWAMEHWTRPWWSKSSASTLLPLAVKRGLAAQTHQMATPITERAAEGGRISRAPKTVNAETAGLAIAGTWATVGLRPASMAGSMIPPKIFSGSLWHSCNYVKRLWLGGHVGWSRWRGRHDFEQDLARWVLQDCRAPRLHSKRTKSMYWASVHGIVLLGIR